MNPHLTISYYYTSQPGAFASDSKTGSANGPHHLALYQEKGNISFEICTFVIYFLIH